MSASDHYSIAFFENDEGEWEAYCKCSIGLGFFPSAEDACDALMEHAYIEGVVDATERAT